MSDFASGDFFFLEGLLEASEDFLFRGGLAVLAAAVLTVVAITGDDDAFPSSRSGDSSFSGTVLGMVLDYCGCESKLAREGKAVYY